MHSVVLPSLDTQCRVQHILCYKCSLARLQWHVKGILFTYLKIYKTSKLFFWYIGQKKYARLWKICDIDYYSIPSTYKLHLTVFFCFYLKDFFFLMSRVLKIIKIFIIRKGGNLMMFEQTDKNADICKISTELKWTLNRKKEINND